MAPTCREIRLPLVSTKVRPWFRRCDLAVARAASTPRMPKTNSNVNAVEKPARKNRAVRRVGRRKRPIHRPRIGRHAPIWQMSQNPGMKNAGERPASVPVAGNPSPTFPSERAFNRPAQSCKDEFAGNRDRVPARRLCRLVNQMDCEVGRCQLSFSIWIRCFDFSPRRPFRRSKRNSRYRTKGTTVRRRGPAECKKKYPSCRFCGS